MNVLPALLKFKLTNTIVICECTGHADCDEIFDIDVCSGSTYCDADTGKCYCEMF